MFVNVEDLKYFDTRFTELHVKIDKAIKCETETETRLNNHIDPNQPCAKMSIHYEKEHKGYTLKLIMAILGLVTALVIVLEKVVLK